MNLPLSCLPGKPCFDSLKPVFITDSKVFMTHSLTAGKKAVGELDRFKIEISFNILKPFRAVPGTALQLQYFNPAQVFIIF